jgi:hypothetical protein
MSERKEYWLAVGHVSDAARQQLINANCLVLDVSSRPPVVLVGLRQESVSDRFHEDLALTNVGEIQVRVKGLGLYWRFPGDWQVAYTSVTETELVTCDE